MHPIQAALPVNRLEIAKQVKVSHQLFTKIETRLHKLEGRFYKDPKSLLHIAAKYSRHEDFPRLQKEQRELLRQCKTLALHHLKPILTQCKSKLLERQKELRESNPRLSINPQPKLNTVISLELKRIGELLKKMPADQHTHVSSSLLKKHIKEVLIYLEPLATLPAQSKRAFLPSPKGANSEKKLGVNKKPSPPSTPIPPAQVSELEKSDITAAKAEALAK